MGVIQYVGILCWVDDVDCRLLEWLATLNDGMTTSHVKYVCKLDDYAFLYMNGYWYFVFCYWTIVFTV